MHLSENDLRAYQDGELPATRQAEAAAHLAECTVCQAELSASQARSRQVRSALDALSPSPAAGSGRKSTAAAWQRFEQRIQEKPSMSTRLSRLRPLWIGLTVVAVLAVALSFSPVQALASSFLQLFRVQQVTALPLDLSSLKDNRYDPTIGQTLSEVLSDQVKITRQSGKAHDVANAAQASKEAGFQVRLSSDPSLQLSRLMVQPGMAFEGTFNQALAQEVLQSFGKGNLQLPAGLDGAVIKANIPDGVSAAYGQCRFNTAPENASATGGPSVGVGDNCLVLVQLPSPTVDTPPDLPVKKLAALALQVLGTDPAKAAQIADSIDWTTTLVIPVPRGEVNAQTVNVDGVSGQLLSQVASTSGYRPTYSLVWVKNGVVYGILASGDTSIGIDLANSLK